ncbi:MAG: hypothetical protein GXP53_03430 [Deltaproteobacteria bacterium]|nr:hypothetical protein [Deltaproteobacteria bacterium]
MCHKYRYMGIIDEAGKRKNFNVNEHLFLNSIHGKVACRECHTYIKKFPHDPVKEKVNCANECHVKPPFAEKNFSHKKIVKIFDESIHGIKPDDSPEMKKAKPNCKYCHQNPLYQKVENTRVSFDKTLARCRNCHEEKGVEQAYKHITHRLRHKTTRSSREIVALCSKNCHGDESLMKKLGVSEEAQEAVETYKESIHGKATTLGSEQSADCISCHASSLIHDIYKKDNPKASVFKDNRLETCKVCHANRNKHFIKIAVHPSIKSTKNPFLFFAEIGLRILLYGVVSGLLGLLFLEIFRRKRDGIRMRLKAGTSWRR